MDCLSKYLPCDFFFPTFFFLLRHASPGIHGFGSSFSVTEGAMLKSTIDKHQYEAHEGSELLVENISSIRRQKFST